MSDRPSQTVTADDVLRLMQQNKLVEAAERCGDLLAAHPGLADGWHLLAAVRYRQGEATAAITAMQQAVALDVGNAARHLDLGEMCRAAGKAEAAIAALCEAIRCDPALALAHFRLGDLLLKSGRAVEACEALRQALLLRPRSPEVAAMLVAAMRSDAGSAATGLLELAAATWRTAPDVPSASLAGKPQVAWMVRDNLMYAPEGVTSYLASTRYRALLPVGEMLAGGRDIAFCTFEEARASRRAPDCQVGVVSKIRNPDFYPAVAALREASQFMVVDFCDNYFQHAQIGPFYRRMVELADRVVASTPMMAQVVVAETGREAAVIGDPYEGQRGDVRFLPGRQLQLLWFGSPSNLETLAPLFSSLAGISQTHPIKLIVLTKLKARELPEFMQAVQSVSCSTMEISVSDWSLAATRQALEASDLVLIPTLGNEQKSVKSPNRLVEAMWAGRFVVAGRLPAYDEFAEFAWVGDDVVAGVLWALAHPEDVIDRIASAQTYIQRRYAPSVIAGQWGQMLDGLLAANLNEVKSWNETK